VTTHQHALTVAFVGAYKSPPAASLLDLSVDSAPRGRYRAALILVLLFVLKIHYVSRVIIFSFAVDVVALMWRVWRPSFGIGARSAGTRASGRCSPSGAGSGGRRLAKEVRDNILRLRRLSGDRQRLGGTIVRSTPAAMRL